MMNEILLQRARNGDPEAFGELRRLLVRCCPNYQSSSGVVPR